MQNKARPVQVMLYQLDIDCLDGLIEDEKKNLIPPARANVSTVIRKLIREASAKREDTSKT